MASDIQAVGLASQSIANDSVPADILKRLTIERKGPKPPVRTTSSIPPQLDWESSKDLLIKYGLSLPTTPTCAPSLAPPSVASSTAPSPAARTLPESSTFSRSMLSAVPVVSTAPELEGAYLTQLNAQNDSNCERVTALMQRLHSSQTAEAIERCREMTAAAAKDAPSAPRYRPLPRELRASRRRGPQAEGAGAGGGGGSAGGGEQQLGEEGSMAALRLDHEGSQGVLMAGSGTSLIQHQRPHNQQQQQQQQQQSPRLSLHTVTLAGKELNCPLNNQHDSAVLAAQARQEYAYKVVRPVLHAKGGGYRSKATDSPCTRGRWRSPRHNACECVLCQCRMLGEGYLCASSKQAAGQQSVAGILASLTAGGSSPPTSRLPNTSATDLSSTSQGEAQPQDQQHETTSTSEPPASSQIPAPSLLTGAVRVSRSSLAYVLPIKDLSKGGHKDANNSGHKCGGLALSVGGIEPWSVALSAARASPPLITVAAQTQQDINEAARRDAIERYISSLLQ